MKTESRQRNRKNLKLARKRRGNTLQGRARKRKMRRTRLRGR
jgi:hypothetical protein